jgi:two-component system, OmpR family, phosphate regulon sensor histidine kinase PhoR
MSVKLNFRRRLFIYLLLIFLVFTFLILIFQANREKEFRRSQLENTLDNITVITNNYLQKENIFETGNYESLKSLVEILPQSDVRITIIDAKGFVLFDSNIEDVSTMENHISRQEVQESIGSEFGSNIRTSATTNEAYYYYAHFYGKYFVRTAVLYNNKIINYLKADQLFLFFITALFFVLWLVLNVVTNKLAKTIDKLKDFVIRLSTGKHLPTDIRFPDDELGVISRQIVDVYKELKNTKDTITLEREKLFNHLFALNEGVAFFSSDKKKILSNNHFIQFLNIISEKSSISAEMIFKSKEFQPILKFIDEYLNSNVEIVSDQLPQNEYSLNKSGHYFDVKCIMFPDKSFEIIITDTTRLAKRQLMKQQMTSNIAHELKTPVAAVIGFIETLQKSNIDEEKRRYFIDKTYAQAYRLKELIEDIKVLNKIEEASDKFTFEPIFLKGILDEVGESLKTQLEDKNIKLACDIDDKININANRSLLESIFHNLIDNSIKYAGDKISINISLYSEDKNFYYFSMKDTGIGIPEEHLNRIFERFYRVDSGRSRKTGGTGLGLAIVKNAIQLHQGSISARNSKDGGLEFLFTLARSIE